MITTSYTGANEPTNTTFNGDGTVMTVTHTIYCYRSDYEYDYKAEEIENMRLGWYIPKKIQLPIQHAKKQIKLQIRNQLPYRIRAEDNFNY